MSWSPRPPAPPRSAGRSLLCTPRHPPPSPRTTVTILPTLQFGLQPWVAREVGLSSVGDSGCFESGPGESWPLESPFINLFIHPLENGIGIILIFDS